MGRHCYEQVVPCTQLQVPLPYTPPPATLFATPLRLHLTVWPALVMTCCQAAHGANPSSRMGVDVVRGEAGDMAELGIFESFRVRQQVGWAGAKGGRACV